MTRRELRKRILGGMGSATQWSKRVWQEMERRLTTWGAGADLKAIGKTILDLVGMPFELVEAAMADFLQNPPERLRYEEEQYRRWFHFREAGSGDPRSGYRDSVQDDFLSPLRQRLRGLDLWQGLLARSSAESPLMIPAPLSRQILGISGDSARARFPSRREKRPASLTDYWSYWLNWHEEASERHLQERKTQGAPPAEIERQARLVEGFKTQKRHLEQFMTLPSAEQRRILEAAVQSKQQVLQEMWGRTQPLARRWVKRLGPGWEKRIEQGVRWTRGRVERHQQIAREAEPAVPAGSRFIGFLPAELWRDESRFVDDWAFLEQIRRERRIDIALERVMLKVDESPLTRARAILEELGRSEAEGNAGIVLGVLGHGDAQELMNLERLYEELHSAHPRLVVSFLFTFREALDRAAAEGWRPVPSFVGWFVPWSADPVPGLMHVLPGVTLPPELWGLFESQLQAQAGLEQAA